MKLLMNLLFSYNKSLYLDLQFILNCIILQNNNFIYQILILLVCLFRISNICSQFFALCLTFYALWLTLFTRYLTFYVLRLAIYSLRLAILYKIIEFYVFVTKLLMNLLFSYNKSLYLVL